MPQGTSFVRVPPQSTGKRVATEERTQLAFDNKTGNFVPGQVVTGAVSGSTGIITGIETEGFAVTAGILWLEAVTGDFQDNEPLEVATVQVALADTSTFANETYNYGQQVIVDQQ